MYTHFFVWYGWCCLFSLCTSVPLYSQVIDRQCSVRFGKIHVNVTMNISRNMDSKETFSLAAYNTNGPQSKPIHGNYCRSNRRYPQRLLSLECRMFDVKDVSAYKLVVVVRNTSVEESALDGKSTMVEITLDHHYIPQEKAFFCYQDHNIKDVQVTPSDNALEVSWKYKSYDRRYYFHQAEVQTVIGKNNTYVIDNVPCREATCRVKLTNLQQCQTYNICVITTFVVYEKTFQCFNGTTSFSGPPPIELDFTCDSNGKNGILSWHNEQAVASAYYSYTIYDLNKSNILRNGTTNMSSIVQSGSSGFKVSVQTCTECGCSKYNRKTFERCRIQSEFPDWAIASFVLGGIILIVIICSIGRHVVFKHSVSDEPPVWPRPQSPIYEDPEIYYDHLNSHVKCVQTVTPNKAVTMENIHVKESINRRSLEVVELPVTSIV